MIVIFLPKKSTYLYGPFCTAFTVAIACSMSPLVNLYLFRAPAEINSKTVSKFEDVTKKHKLFADIIEATRDVHTYKFTLDGTELIED